MNTTHLTQISKVTTVPGKVRLKWEEKATKVWDRIHMDFVISHKLRDAEASVVFKEKPCGVRAQPRRQRTEFSFKRPRQAGHGDAYL